MKKESFNFEVREKAISVEMEEVLSPVMLLTFSFFFFYFFLGRIYVFYNMYGLLFTFFHIQILLGFFGVTY
jgi:hypothetical protein